MFESPTKREVQASEVAAFEADLSTEELALLDKNDLYCLASDYRFRRGIPLVWVGSPGGGLQGRLRATQDFLFRQLRRFYVWGRIMSNVRFITGTQIVDVSGTEKRRSYQRMRMVAVAFMDPLVWLSDEERARYDAVFGHECPQPEKFATSVAACLTCDPYLGWDMLDMQLNTVLAFGSDELALVARLGAQGEIHPFVEEEDRPWFARLIASAVSTGLLSEKPRGYDGWGAVTSLLLSDAPGPVVLDYSITETWPSLTPWELVDEEPPYDYEAWCRLPYEERFKLALDQQRKNTRMRWTPATWRTDRFGDGRTMRDFSNWVWGVLEGRVDPTLPVKEVAGEGKE